MVVGTSIMAHRDADLRREETITSPYVVTGVVQP
jgi:hypothetical protein